MGELYATTRVFQRKIRAKGNVMVGLLAQQESNQDSIIISMDLKNCLTAFLVKCSSKTTTTTPPNDLMRVLELKMDNEF